MQHNYGTVKYKAIFSHDQTRSSADADNGLDAFSGQSRSTNMVPFWVHCDFSLS